MRRRVRKPNHGYPFQLKLYSDFRSLSDNQQRNTIAHEGLHTLPGEAVFIGLPGFRRMHGPKYRKAASELLDE